MHMTDIATPKLLFPQLTKQASRIARSTLEELKDCGSPTIEAMSTYAL
jgi:hypothetical protein